MSNFINIEVKFFLLSIAWGAILLVIYDCLRIFRKVIKHGTVLTSVEDIIYWMVSSVLIFRMMYDLNDGIIRGFSLLGILLGMILYKYSISDAVVKGISFVLIKVKKLIGKIIHILTKPVTFAGKQVERFVFYLGRKMKKRLGIMSHFLQNRLVGAWKALQTKAKRGRMKANDRKEKQKMRKAGQKIAKAKQKDKNQAAKAAVQR